MNKNLKKQSYRWLMQQAKIARPWLITKIIILYFSCILLIIQAALIASLIDQAIIQHQTINQLILPMTLLIAVMLLRAVISWGQELLGFQAGAVVRTAVRQHYLKNVEHLGPIRLTQENSGVTATAFIEQIEALQSFYADYLPQLPITIMVPLTILLVIFPINWLAGLIFLITAPLIPLFMALIGMGVEAANQKHFKSLAILSADFLDKLRGLITLKLFNQSKNQINKIAITAENYREKIMEVLRVAFLSSAALELFSSASIAIVAIVLGLTLLHDITIGYAHQFTLTKALFILLLAPEFFLPLRQLGVYYHARAEAIAAATELLRFFSKLQSNKTLLNFTVGKSSIALISPITIEMKNISFAYPNKPPLFHKFNLLINPREKIAIIGASGAGKTTLINLMMGFLQPQEGNIFINHTNLAEIDWVAWRKKIAYLGQTPQLFHGTIKENIQFANPTATDAEIITAAEKAGVMHFIDQFPLGLNSKLAEQNLGLSGGQAQRVALARIFLVDRPILILDEPTASLDEQTEQQIINSIKTNLHDKTIIVISHRQETTEIAERIIEL